MLTVFSLASTSPRFHHPFCLHARPPPSTLSFPYEAAACTQVAVTFKIFPCYKHADKAEGERRIKAGLTSFMRDKGLEHGNADVGRAMERVHVGRAMERVDTNTDGGIDYAEFCALSQANSDLEKVLQAKHLEGILGYYFPKGTTLEDLRKMDRAQFSAIVKLSQQTMVQLLVDLAAQVAAVGEAQDCGGARGPGGAAGGIQGRSQRSRCRGEIISALGERRGASRLGADPLEGRR